MEFFLYVCARTVLGLIRALPLRMAARLGRVGGAVAYLLDGRHRRVALRNLQMCFGEEKTPRQIKALARENFRRIGESFASAARTAFMDFSELQQYVEFAVPAEIVDPASGNPPEKIVVAIGHFGNFELYARFGQLAPAFKCASTYRGLRQPSLNRLLQSLRERSGCQFFERRFDAPALRTFMNQRGILLGLLADQHAGINGLRLPFMGHECSTSAAPAIFALRYQCALYTSICHRIGLAQWRIEAGQQIPTHEAGCARTVEAIMRDVNRAFEGAVRHDPANWFWVHNRWKTYKPKRVPGKEQEPASVTA